MSLILITFLLQLPAILNGSANVIEASTNLVLAIDVLLKNELVCKLLITTFSL